MSIKYFFGLEIEVSNRVPAKGMLVANIGELFSAHNDSHHYIPKLPRALEFFNKDNNLSSKSRREKLYHFLKFGMISNRTPKRSRYCSRPKLTIISFFPGSSDNNSEKSD